MNSKSSIQFGYVVYRENIYGKFIKSAIIPISGIYYNEDKLAKNIFIEPRDKDDYNHNSTFFIKICKCALTTEDEDCKDLTKCEEYNVYRGYVLHLSGT